MFICPSDKSKPYVKRVIGRPNETIQLQDGDVWIDGPGSQNAGRKRQCRVPVFESDFTPPGGWDFRWLVDGTRYPIGISKLPDWPDWLRLDAWAVFLYLSQAFHLTVSGRERAKA